MAYSNINKDKGQDGVAGKLKMALLTLILLTVIFSSFYNIYNKWNILNEAKSRNDKLAQELDTTVTENKLMQRQIDEASASAQVSRKAREYFGLGSINDNWLILPNDGPNIKVEYNTSETDYGPNILKWWKLFTN